MIDSAHSETVEEICRSFDCKAPEGIDYFGRSNYRCDEEGEFIDEETRTHVK